MRDVRRTGGSNVLDRMESFWIAETLKYFYLLQEDEASLPLDTYVFNMEALDPGEVVGVRDFCTYTSVAICLGQ